MCSEKTTLFRWKPDWEAAAEAWNDAANKYRTIKMTSEASNAFKRAAEAYAKARLYVFFCFLP